MSGAEAGVARRGRARGGPRAPSDSAGTRVRILDAAALVAHEAGPANLSLDAVAERAGISKGGLLYHFPTKQDLLKALVERHLAAIEAAVEVAPGGGACEGNDVALGLLRSYCTFSSAKAGGGRDYLAAIAETPSLLDPIREHNSRMVDRLRRGTSSDLALISFFVVEGMRSLELFDSNPLSRWEC